MPALTFGAVYGQETGREDSLLLPRSDSEFRTNLLPYLQSGILSEPDMIPLTGSIYSPPGLINPRELSISPSEILGSYKLPSRQLLTAGPFHAEPFGIHYRTPATGGNIGGLAARLDVTDRLTIYTSAYYSSSYFGHLRPGRLSAGAVNVQAEYRIADRLYLVGIGQYSTYKHTDPFQRIDPGPGNYFGGGLIMMITDNFGIMYTTNREFIRGKWVTTHSASPVIMK